MLMKLTPVFHLQCAGGKRDYADPVALSEIILLFNLHNQLFLCSEEHVLQTNFVSTITVS
jgi:hypothetical protein